MDSYYKLFLYAFRFYLEEREKNSWYDEEEAEECHHRGDIADDLYDQGDGYCTCIFKHYRYMNVPDFVVGFKVLERDNPRLWIRFFENHEDLMYDFLEEAKMKKEDLFSLFSG